MKRIVLTIVFSRAVITLPALPQRITERFDPKRTEFRRENFRISGEQEWTRSEASLPCRTPTQEPSGQSRCFCGKVIDVRQWSGLCQRLYADNLVSDLSLRSEAFSLLRERVLRRLKADIAARSAYPQTKPTRNANVNSVASILHVCEIIWCWQLIGVKNPH